MEKFTTLEGVAAPLKIINVDTDMIIFRGAATPSNVVNFSIDRTSQVEI